jgi:DNA (cytosine-5)-methyltransferase 1
MNLFNLFGGGGLMTFGLRLKVLAAIDLWKSALNCYELNHPGVPTVEADLEQENAESVLARCPLTRRVDVLHGSAPCQPWSSARQKLGRPSYAHDKRRFMLFKPIDYVRLLRPEFVILENVRGLTFLAPGPIWLGVLIKELERLGYSVPDQAWQCRVSAKQRDGIGFVEQRGYWLLNSADYGAPQVRRRVFIVARRNGGKFPDPPKPTHQGAQKPNPPIFLK